MYRGTCVAWSSKTQTVTATSTCQAETIAQSDMLAISDDVMEVSSMLRTANEREHESSIDKRGPLWCDNRSVVINSKKDFVSDIPKRSRHVALRAVKYQEEGRRTYFTPTDLQLSDGLTKLKEYGSIDNLINLFFPQNAVGKWVAKAESEAMEPRACTVYAVKLSRKIRPNFGVAWYGEIVGGKMSM